MFSLGVVRKGGATGSDDFVRHRVRRAAPRAGRWAEHRTDHPVAPFFNLTYGRAKRLPAKLLRSGFPADDGQHSVEFVRFHHDIARLGTLAGTHDVARL